MWQKMFLSEHLQRLRFKIGLSFIHVTHDKREEKKNFFMYTTTTSLPSDFFKK